MMMNMESLVSQFSALASVSIINPTPYALYVNNEALYTSQALKKDTVIGEIKGDPDYIWNLNHKWYILIDNDLVLDVHRYRYNMLAYVREENETCHMKNCYIQMITDMMGGISFYLITNRDILSNEELVYSTFDFIQVNLP